MTTCLFNIIVHALLFARNDKDQVHSGQPYINVTVKLFWSEKHQSPQLKLSVGDAR